MIFAINPSYTPFIQLCIAVGLGMILGIERVLAGRTAGPRTYGLVSLGSCLITILSLNAVPLYQTGDSVRLDPMVLISAAISGVGFIGAGLIIFHGTKLSGLTTAAGIWVSAGIGIAVGFNMYLIAVFTTFLTLFMFSIMWRFENALKSRFANRTIEEDEGDDDVGGKL